MYNLLIANPAGFRLECPEVGHFIGQVMSMADRAKIHVHISSPMWARIHQARNLCVADAQACGATHLLFVDPDQVPDAYLTHGQLPFWPTAWEFVLAHPGTVVTAPYCGAWPARPVHVFGSDKAGRLHRVSHQWAMQQTGWVRVAAAGTGLMLIDMSVFNSLEPPYFFDTWSDAAQTTLKHTQDVAFCKRLHEAGHELWCNFSCWSGHYQNCMVDPPGMEGLRDTEVDWHAASPKV